MSYYLRLLSRNKSFLLFTSRFIEGIFICLQSLIFDDKDLAETFIFNNNEFESTEYFLSS